MSQVREYGEQNEVEQLVTKCWSADETDGWEMTSIAGFLLRAKGAYRTSGENGFTYMVIMDIGWVSS
jgi:hypothetical protein